MTVHFPFPFTFEDRSISAQTCSNKFAIWPFSFRCLDRPLWVWPNFVFFSISKNVCEGHLKLSWGHLKVIRCVLGNEIFKNFKNPTHVIRREKFSQHFFQTRNFWTTLGLTVIGPVRGRIHLLTPNRTWYRFWFCFRSGHPGHPWSALLELSKRKKLRKRKIFVRF